MTQNSIEIFTTTLDKAAGAVVYPNAVDFRVNTEVDIDLSQLTETGQVGFISGVYCDNSQGAQGITLQVIGSNQTVIFPAYSFGYLPIFVPNPPKFRVSTPVALGGFVNLFFHNTPIPPFIHTVA